VGHAHARDETGMAGERVVRTLLANGVKPSSTLPHGAPTVALAEVPVCSCVASANFPNRSSHPGSLSTRKITIVPNRRRGKNCCNEAAAQPDRLLDRVDDRLPQPPVAGFHSLAY